MGVIRQYLHDWAVDRLDLDAYCARIGYSADLSPRLENFHALHAAHVASVPFENLDVILGRLVDADLVAVQDKVVGRGRGGYCYEMNVLFTAALETVGFDVRRVLARIGDPGEKSAPRTHLVGIVTIDGVQWLSDVGFGSGLLHPAPLIDGHEVEQGGWRYRVIRGGDGAWRMQRWSDEGWATGYTVAEEATYPADVAVANHWTSTYARSIFVRQPVVIRRAVGIERSLVGRTATVLRPDGCKVEQVLDDDAMREWLADSGLPLTAADVEVLVRWQPTPDE